MSINNIENSHWKKSSENYILAKFKKILTVGHDMTTDVFESKTLSRMMKKPDIRDVNNRKLDVGIPLMGIPPLLLKLMIDWPIFPHKFTFLCQTFCVRINK